MRYKFYTTSSQAWTAMLEAIQAAQQSIYLESYILADDEITHNFFEVLKKKAASGIKVKIIVDRVGNFWTGGLNKQEFEKTGAEVLFFNRWLYRDHRKILIVDEKIAFIGGVNIRGEYAKWLDLHLRLTGRLVRHILHSFIRVYRLAGGSDASLLSIKKHKFFKTRTLLYRAKTFLVERWPIKGRSALRGYYKKACARAQKSIMIVTPYFIPHRWLIKTLNQAVQRNIKVEILIPAKIDHWLANTANWIFAYLLRDGIKFYFLPELNHAKVLLIDNQEGLVGSNNIDALSFDFNLEASVVFNQKNMVADLKKIIERWKATAIPFEKMDLHWRWYYPLLIFLIKLIQPIL